jgi:site-specific recombinase XerD
MVQKQLGHSSITTTTVYSDVLNKDLEDALENLE